MENWSEVSGKYDRRKENEWINFWTIDFSSKLFSSMQSFENFKIVGLTHKNRWGRKCKYYKVLHFFVFKLVAFTLHFYGKISSHFIFTPFNACRAKLNESSLKQKPKTGYPHTNKHSNLAQIIWDFFLFVFIPRHRLSVLYWQLSYDFFK